MSRKGSNKGSYIAMVFLTILVLAVATLVLVFVGKKFVEHEREQASRIETLEGDKTEYELSISERNEKIAQLEKQLSDTQSELDALSDVYSLTAGKVDELEEFKKDIEDKIAKGELGGKTYTSETDEKKTEIDETQEEKKDNKKTDSDKKDDTDKEDTKKESKTKGVYRKLVKGEDINLLIVGDSIAEPMEEDSWVQLLKNWISNTYKVNCTVTNVAMSGTTSYAGYVRTMMLDDSVDYDLAILCFAHNDSDANLKYFYECAIKAIQTKFEKCAIISILESSQREYTEKIKIVQELCRYYDIPMADTIQAFNASPLTYEQMSNDGVHPNAEGKKIYFETIKNVIAPRVEANTKYVYTERDVLACDWKSYDKFTFYDTSQWTRVDDCTYELGDVKINGFLGIYWEFVPGNSGYTIYADGKVYAEATHKNFFDFSQPYIYNVSNNWCKASKLKIVFSSKAAADSFKGMAYSR